MFVFFLGFLQLKVLNESPSCSEILEHGRALPAHSPKVSLAVSVAPENFFFGRFFAQIFSDFGGENWPPQSCQNLLKFNRNLIEN